MSEWLLWGVQLAVAVLGGSAVGALIASELSWRRTEKKIRGFLDRLSRDEELKARLKAVAREFIDTALDELKQKTPEIQAMFMMRVGKAPELPKELVLAEVERK
jgi:predicted acylesterase/phospholipase RssA